MRNAFRRRAAPGYSDAMTGPTLTTARLTLRPYTPADLEDAAAMWGDPAVVAMIGGHPFTREEAWHRILRYIGHWSAIGYGCWTVRETATGAYAGEVVLMDSRRATEPSFEGTPEAGWAFNTRFHGRGLAREAVAAMLAWADAHGLPRTVAMIAPANAPSIALAGKLGYRPAGEVAYKGASSLLFERNALPETR